MADARMTRQQLVEELAALRARHQAICGLRARIWSMQRAEDIRQVVEEVGHCLRALGVPFQDTGINLVNSRGEGSAAPHTLSAQGEYRGPEDAWGVDLLLRVWQGGVPVYRPDLQAEDVHGERQRAARYFGHPVRSVLDVPFSHGTVAVNSAMPHAFTETDIAVVSEVAQVLSEGFSRMEDLRSVERRAREAESLASAIAVVSSTRQLRAVLDAVVVEATRMLSTERCTLFLYDEEEGVLVPRAQVGHDWETYRHIRLVPGEDMSGQVFASGSPFLIEPGGTAVPARRAETTALFERAVQGRALSGGASVPLRLGDRVIGTLAVGTAHRPLVWHDVEMLQRLADQAALAIDRARREEDLERRLRELQAEVAERERRASQRAARQRIREEVWRMQSTADIRQVLVALGQGMEALGVPFRNWGVDVVDGRAQPPRVHFQSMTRDGEWRTGEVGPPGRELVLGMWRGQDPVHRADLTAAEASQDRLSLEAGFGRGAASAVHIPFSHGVLAVYGAAPGAFSEADTANLREVAEVLSEGFRRVEDLQRLAAEHERLLVTLRSIGDGVIATDAEGHISLVNKAAEELTGWSHEEAAGRPLGGVFRIVSERTGEPCEDPVSRVVHSGVVVGLANHTVLVRRDGVERSIADSGAPIRDRDGRIIGVVLVFRDVTAQRRLEAELLRTEKLESLGVLAGGIAHDFNNILTSIIGTVSLARMDLKPTDALLGPMTQVEQAAWRATQLTQQLLTFARGGAPVRRTASLPQLIEASASFALSGTNVRCEYAIDQGLWPADVDTGQVSQVIQNLVINAHQAMPGGGRLRIGARNLALQAGSSLPLKEGRYVEIEVADEGVGIPPKHLQRIFEPYFSTKRRGSGLGLATAHSIIANHEGHIAVESRMGVGTTFRIYLPARPEATPPRVGDSAAPAAGHGRILLVDDDEALLVAARCMLQHLGYQVVCAGDGAEGLSLYLEARAAGEPFAAVILDLTIPGGMGGKETVTRLLAADSRVKAVVSSGYSHDPVMSDYRRYGFSGVVAKPYDVSELGRVLREVLAAPG
ncbi:MAG: GAF domain-containing protein [Candidatus Latescibacterota bacterium]